MLNKIRSAWFPLKQKLIQQNKKLALFEKKNKRLDFRVDINSNNKKYVKKKESKIRMRSGRIE